MMGQVSRLPLLVKTHAASQKINTKIDGGKREPERMVRRESSIALHLVALGMPCNHGTRRQATHAKATSASSQMRRIVVTVSTTKSPMADSLLSITASVPSSTALATSQASARVGKGLSSMDASISVAVITNFPAAFVF